MLSVRWLHNGKVIDVLQSRFDGANLEQTAMVVNNASRHDSGSYSCELGNEIGIVMSENQVLIDVQCKFYFNCQLTFTFSCICIYQI